MNYKISIEGQTIDLPEEIAGDDAKLRAALTPFFPGAANAKFMRTPPKDEVVTVTVIKQAGTKGSDHDLILIDGPLKPQRELGDADDLVLRRLIEAEEGQNPVVDLNTALEGKTLNQLGIEKLLELDSEIDETLEVGRKERDRLENTLSLLKRTAPQPASSVPTGF